MTRLVRKESRGRSSVAQCRGQGCKGSVAMADRRSQKGIDPNRLGRNTVTQATSPKTPDPSWPELAERSGAAPVVALGQFAECKHLVAPSAVLGELAEH